MAAVDTRRRGAPVEPSQPEVPPQQRRRSRAARFAWLVIAVVGLVLVLVPNVIAGHGPTGAPSSMPSPSAGLASVPVPRASVQDVTWTSVAGLRVPTSAVAGPTCGPQPRVACFGHTTRGGAFAAVNLLVRTFPFVGSGIFAPTIDSQVVGQHRAALLRLTTDAYTQAAAASGTADGAPLPVEQGDAVAGYRLVTSAAAGGPSDELTVGVLLRQVEDGGGPSFTEFEVQLVWRDGDWRLVAPPWGDWRNAARPVMSPDPDAYTSYDAAAGETR